MGKNPKRSKARINLKKIGNVIQVFKKIKYYLVCFSLGFSSEFLKQYNCKYNKIASAMLVDKAFMKAWLKKKILYQQECLK